MGSVTQGAEQCTGYRTMKHQDPLETRDRLRERKKAHIEALVRETKRISAEVIKMGARKVILFGSMIQDNAGLSSDLDLLIVMDSDLDFIERSADIFRRLKPEVGADIMVYTPDEFEKMKANPFIQKIIGEGRVLYET
jgi:predicted nucleotidyltransferase